MIYFIELFCKLNSVRFKFLAENLCVKIPWKNLYTEKWEVTVDGLVIIVVPNNSIEYNEEKEAQYLHQVKLATLDRIEASKERKRLKDLGKENETQDGFIEKLAAQVIRNIQISVNDIHVRYEDGITSKPFASGFVMKNLVIKSTEGLGSNDFIDKVMCIDGFLLYWSPKTRFLSNNYDDMRQQMFDLIHSRSTEYPVQPIVGPLAMNSELQLNPRPENNVNPFEIPKAVLNVILNNLTICISRLQFQAMLTLLDSIDSLQVSSNYRKYRPKVNSIKGQRNL